MAWSVSQKTVKDGTGVTFPLDALTDATNWVSAGAIFDPVNNKWATVDSSGRLAVLADFNGTQVVSGAGTFNVDNITNVLGEVTLLGSAARTASVGVTTTGQSYYKGAYISVDVSAQSGGSITPVFYIVNGTFSKNLTVLTAPSAITTVSTNWYYIGPTAPPVATIPANQAAIMALPKNWGMSVTANNASSITYSATILYHF